MSSISLIMSLWTWSSSLGVGVATALSVSLASGPNIIPVAVGLEGLIQPLEGGENVIEANVNAATGIEAALTTGKNDNVDDNVVVDFSGEVTVGEGQAAADHRKAGSAQTEVLLAELERRISSFEVELEKKQKGDAEGVAEGDASATASAIASAVASAASSPLASDPTLAADIVKTYQEVLSVKLSSKKLERDFVEKSKQLWKAATDAGMEATMKGEMSLDEAYTQPRIYETFYKRRTVLFQYTVLFFVDKFCHQPIWTTLEMEILRSTTVSTFQHNPIPSQHNPIPSQHNLIPSAFHLEPALYLYTKETAHEYDMYVVGTNGRPDLIMAAMGNNPLRYYHFLSFKLFALLLDLMVRLSPVKIWSLAIRTEPLWREHQSPRIPNSVVLPALLHQVQKYVVKLLQLTTTNDRIRFAQKHSDGGGGVHPEVLRPVFVTLSYIAKRRRNEAYRACYREVVGERELKRNIRVEQEHSRRRREGAAYRLPPVSDTIEFSDESGTSNSARNSALASANESDTSMTANDNTSSTTISALLDRDLEAELRASDFQVAPPRVDDLGKLQGDWRVRGNLPFEPVVEHRNTLEFDLAADQGQGVTYLECYSNKAGNPVIAMCCEELDRDWWVGPRVEDEVGEGEVWEGEESVDNQPNDNIRASKFLIREPFQSFYAEAWRAHLTRKTLNRKVFDRHYNVIWDRKSRTRRMREAAAAQLVGDRALYDDVSRMEKGGGTFGEGIAAKIEVDGNHGAGGRVPPGNTMVKIEVDIR